MLIVYVLVIFFSIACSFTTKIIPVEHVAHSCRLHKLFMSSVTTPRKTFKRFLQIELWRSPELEDLYPILCNLENACRDINRLMRRISTDNLQGYYTGVGSSDVANINIQGEDQKKLDVIANRILKTAICCSGKVDVIASEEDDDICSCSSITDNSAFTGKFAVVFDPLDGSSNIDGGLPTGTIFGIYRQPKFGPTDGKSVILQRGTEMLVSGYCMYSASTHLVCTFNSGVHQFTLDDVTGEFFLTRSSIKIPPTGPIYSFNDANSKSWSPSSVVTKYLEDFKNRALPGVSNKEKPAARYMGALVADLHNIIRNGGIFGYPAEVKKPNGKIRLLYEAIPLAKLVEEAGGKASSGAQRILDIPITSIHQRTALYIGSAEEVTALEKRFANGV